MSALPVEARSGHSHTMNLSPSSTLGRNGVAARTGSLALTVLAAAVISGCAALGNSHSTQTLAEPGTMASPQTFTADHGQWPSQDWVDQFHDPQLRALADEAVKDNPNLQVALARLEASRAMADATRAALYPSVDFEGSIIRQRFSA